MLGSDWPQRGGAGGVLPEPDHVSAAARDLLGVSRRLYHGLWIFRGSTPNPTYQEVCSGQTGHNEVVLVAFNSSQVSFDRLLLAFWENHDPTQGMRQGNDVGTQYRSGIYCQTTAQQQAAEASREVYQRGLSAAGYGQISTEIQPAGQFYYAEDYHQQYLAKNPGGYCGLGGTGVSCG